MDLGGAIRRCRELKNIRQNKFAQKIKISQTSLSLIELNKKRPHHSTLKKICNGLGISEPLLYIMAIEQSDVPDNKQKEYDVMYKPWISIMQNWAQVIFANTTINQPK